jgi:hypothetical protein
MCQKRRWISSSSHCAALSPSHNALTGGTLALMFQLEPMMAEENSNVDSYDGRDGVSQTVFVWGETILVNIEGEIQNIITSQLREVQPDKKYGRGRAGRVTLPGEWGRHCSTVASHLAWRRRNHPWWNMGGGQGVFTVALTKHGTTHHLSPPPKNPRFMEWGGGWGCSPWLHPSPRH